MAQIFPRWTNKVPLAIGAGTPIVLCGVVFFIWYYFSPKYTDVGYQPEQPVPFSHKLHAGEIGLDCRYCHNTVEQTAHAAIPPAGTCMNCHSQIDLGDNERRIAPVKEAFDGGEPVEWIRVHMLPEYAYFDHSAHLAAGVGCSTCHGRVDQMEVVAQEQSLSMSWCLTCHRDPEPNLRPHDQITNMDWIGSKAEADYKPDEDPFRTRKVNPPKHCSGCHR